MFCTPPSKKLKFHFINSKQKAFCLRIFTKNSFSTLKFLWINKRTSRAYVKLPPSTQPNKGAAAYTNTHTYVYKCSIIVSDVRITASMKVEWLLTFWNFCLYINIEILILVKKDSSYFLYFLFLATPSNHNNGSLRFFLFCFSSSFFAGLILLTKGQWGTTLNF